MSYSFLWSWMLDKRNIGPEGDNMLPKHRKNNWSENRSTGVWRHFLDAHPEYLARHYWWAYLWRFGVWFFDHQPIINAILFGQYRALKTQALHACMTDRPKGRLLQLTCVYGNLTPSLIKLMKGDDLYLMDVADVQLGATREKLDDKEKNRVLTARMNAEHLAYCDDAFSSVLIFFLLHELPSAARDHTLDETLVCQEERLNLSCCIKDESRSLGFGDQKLESNHLMRLL